MFIIPAIQAVKTRCGASCGSPSFVVTSLSPTRIGNQDIFSPSTSITARRGRNVELFDASINRFLAVNGHSTSYFSGVSGAETVSAEFADINPCERVNFASNAVIGKNSKFVDMGLSPAHTVDKIKSVISPAIRAEGLMGNSDGLTSSHGISKVVADRVSEAKAYSDYTKNYEYETPNFFEIQNDSGTRINQMTRPDQYISRINPMSRINPESQIIPDSRINLDSRINSPIRINSTIRPTINIPLTRPTEIIPLTRPTYFELLTRPTYFELLTRPTELS